MLVFRVSYSVDDLFSIGDSYVSSLEVKDTSNQIIFKDTKLKIIDRLSDDFGILVFPNIIQITNIQILMGNMIDLIEIDQSHSVSIKNAQTSSIQLFNLITTSSTRCFLIEVVGVDISGCHISIEADVLQLGGRFDLFPSIDNSEIGFLNIKTNPTFHYDDQIHSPLIISSSLIGKIVILNVCVGGLDDDESSLKIHELIQMIENTIVQTLNILHLEFHSDDAQIGIHIDSSSRLLNIEIEDNTKVRKIPLE